VPFRVAIAGAGPAGLYAAILLKRTWPGIDLRITEQNPPDATFGFGVVFSDQALGFLREDDPETAALIEPHMERWSDIAVVHRGERIAIDGVGFAAIGRLPDDDVHCTTLAARTIQAAVDNYMGTMVKKV
jgi:2-polyprenyl-6-methoxyphenol hydroxylase-like FAD-dependent oxidoreductase